MRKLPFPIAVALFIVVIGAALMFLQTQGSNQQDFHAGVDNSIASKTINVASASVWDVQVEISYSDRQKQSYLDKVSRRIVATGPGAAWRPTQHLPLALTVSESDGGSSRVIHEEIVENEPFYGGGNHAGFLVVGQLHLDPGKYVVSIRTLKGDPALSEFGARLLVGPQ